MENITASLEMSPDNGCDGRPEFGFLNINAQSEKIDYDYEIILSSASSSNSDGDFDEGSIDVLAHMIQDEVTSYVRNKLICDVQYSSVFNSTSYYGNDVYSVDASPRDALDVENEQCLSDESNPNCYPINGYISAHCDSCSMSVLQTTKEAMDTTNFTSLSNGKITQVNFLGQRFISTKQILGGIDVFFSKHVENITNFASDNITVMGGAFIAGLVLSFSLLIYRFKSKKRQRQLQEDFCDDNELQLEVEERYASRGGKKAARVTNTGVMYYDGSKDLSHKVSNNSATRNDRQDDVFQDEDNNESRFNMQYIRESKHENGDEEFEVEIY